MPRQARLDSPGTLHHVMIREIEKKRIVLDEQDRKRLCATIGFIGRGNEDGGLCMGVDE
jgi:putative transposase